MKFKKGTATLFLAAFSLSVLFYFLLGQTVVQTVLNAIFSFAGKAGPIISKIIIFCLIPGLATLIIQRYRKRDNNAYQDYVASMENKTYDARQDLTEIWQNPYVRGELATAAVITVVFTVGYWLYSFIKIFVFTRLPFSNSLGALVFLAVFPLFMVFNILAHMVLHKNWIDFHNSL